MWARFDDGYDENPKCRAAGKDGRALDQTAIRYSARHLTDGLIPDHDLPVLLAIAEVPKRTIAKLVDVGRWHSPGHDCSRCPDCPPGHHVVHDYLEFNPEAERELAKRRARAEAGRKGGQKSRPPGTKPASEPEATEEANASANGEAPTNPVPVPVPPEVLTSSSNSHSRATPPDDDQQQHHQPPEAQHHGPAPPVVEAALRQLAQRDLDRRRQATHREPVGDPSSWLNEAVERRRNQHTARAAELHQLNPGITVEALANQLEPAEPDPPRADLARARANTQRQQEQPPPPPSSTPPDFNALREQIHSTTPPQPEKLDP